MKKVVAETSMAEWRASFTVWKDGPLRLGVRKGRGKKDKGKNRTYSCMWYFDTMEWEDILFSGPGPGAV